MIGKVAGTMKNGYRNMTSNPQMLLVAVLVFVFPLLFIWANQSFFETSYNNIKTLEKQKVGILHNSIAAVLEAGDLEAAKETINTLYSLPDNVEITKVRLLTQEEEGFLIVHDTNPDLVNTNEKASPNFYTLKDLAFSEQLNLQQIDYIVNGYRVAHAYSQVNLDQTYYIFSEHNYRITDSTIAARKVNSYYSLTAIFIFLICLAYWLNKQTNWKKRNDLIKLELEERGMFINMIAHEFRTPLTAIKGYAGFLQESENLSLEEKRYSNNIKDSAHRLVLLVNDFLEVARIQSGKLDLEMKRINLNETVTEVLHSLTALAKEKNLDLLLDQNSDTVIFATDKNRMIQILTNIITNALKYTEAGSVKILLKEDKRRVSVRVMDTGMGISADDQKNLFQPFSRVGGVDDKKIIGTGLGMYITKQMVTILDGDITVESIKGVGSHVVISFPKPVD